jgi:hypothetical protein
MKNMPNLKCHKQNCEHNHNIKCGLEGIYVNQHAVCESYESRSGEPFEFTQEFAKDLAMTFTDKSTDVTCHDHECQNNEHECCMLDNLRIDDLDNAAICVNFRKRN